MKRGKDQIVACPKCGALAHHMTLMSGSMIGARVWTDAKQIAPMLPVPPAVVRCAACSRCYWLADAEPIGLALLWVPQPVAADPSWLNAPEIAEPTDLEYYAALAAGLAEDSVQERNLRIMAWQRRNDSFRELPDTESRSETMSTYCRQNLDLLLDLLVDEDDSDRLMRAEIYRELGRFDAARAILTGLEAPEFAGIVAALMALCERKDSLVREIRASSQ